MNYLLNVVYWLEHCFLLNALLTRFDKPAGVRSCYDEGKRTAETLTMDYHRGLGIEVV